MADKKQLEILEQGVIVWNRWRAENPDKKVSLHRANLRERKLDGVNLRKANLRRANLSLADLSGADLTEAKLSRADLRGSTLSSADLRGADLRGADLFGAYLSTADLSQADLSGADLTRTYLNHCILVETTLVRAYLTQARIYGVSVWNVNLKESIQQDLIITTDMEPTITVDNLEVAQFIHLLLTNEKIRDVIDTIAKKVVLILGRFTDKRLDLLRAIREKLREMDYSPVLFDFPAPEQKNWVKTVETLAHMCRFVIMDLTDPKMVLLEMARIDAPV